MSDHSTPEQGHRETTAPCPDPSVHGEPFRYCPYCDWVEDLRPSVWSEIVAERERAHRKHGDTSMESCDPMADRRLRVLTEEVGEVARVLNDREHDIAKGEYLAEARAQMHLREELIQVAAMAVAWIAALDGEALS